MYKHIKEKWKDPEEEIPQELRKRLARWRKQGAINKIDKPTRLDRARNLGYKAKQGFVMARARVRKGTRKKQKVSGGRRSRRSGKYQPRDKSKQRVAEERTSKKFTNLRVLNSYWVGEDGKHKWFEVILVDPEHPSIKKDEDVNWICKDSEKDRALQGKTSQGK